MFKIFLFLSFLSLFSSTYSKTQEIIHKAHLSNGWYNQNENLLNKELENYFNFSSKNLNVFVDSNSIRALIVPHAGFYYSGICAASAYQTLLKKKEKNKKIKKIIILSPSHVKAFKGISLPNYDIYQTVFGKINVDKKSIEKLSKNNLFKKIEFTHEKEHGIELQLPFLQKTVEQFEIIPLIVGHIETNEYDSIAKTLKEIIDDSTLIIISSDFIHYGSRFDYEPFRNNILNNIKATDSLAIETIIQQSFKNFSSILQKTGATICGQNSIKILLKLLETNVLGNTEARLSCYYTSPQIEQAYKKNKKQVQIKNLIEDTSDINTQNSVSYVGLIFTTQKLESLKEQDRLTDYEKESLLKLARQTIENNLTKEKKIPEHLLYPIKSLGLQQTCGAFVTLNTKDGKLRGCIGRIITNQQLYQTVQEMSKAAAFQDTRFFPVQKNELMNIIIDITILTKPISIKNYKEIKLGKDGIILKKFIKNKGYFSSVFLPQVPLSLNWNLQTTLEQLSLKAGLGKNDWKKDCEFEVFQGYEIKEK